MAFGRFIFILFLLLSQVAHAQTILMFEDQTKTGFKLIMNNYLQNETALPKLNLQKFPDAENEVYLVLENGIHIKRKLPKLPKGNHKYVIYKDFKGKHHLCYRGISTELSQSALMFDYKEMLVFNEPAIAAIQQADTLSHFPDLQQNFLQQILMTLVKQWNSWSYTKNTKISNLNYFLSKVNGQYVQPIQRGYYIVFSHLFLCPYFLP